MLELLKEWALARWEERTSWNGTWLIGVGVVALLFKPLINVVAWAAIAYGVYQIFKKEQ